MICSFSSFGPKFVRYCPIGFFPGKTCAAAAWLMIATGSESVAVAFAKIPTLQQRNTHGRKIIRRARTRIGLVAPLIAEHAEGARAVPSGKRQLADRADRLHSGQRLESSRLPSR